MSDSALATALPLMQDAVGREVPVVFHLSDMLSFLKNVRGSYDVVIAAFSLHHLISEDKQEARPRMYAGSRSRPETFLQGVVLGLSLPH